MVSEEKYTKKITMCLKIIILLFQVSTTFCINSPLVEKALQIADSSYSHNFATSIVWCSTNNDQQILEFLTTYKGSVLLTPLQNENHKEIRKYYKQHGYKQTVLFAADVEEFAKFVTTLKVDIVVPMRLILVLTQPITDAVMIDITQTAWDNYLTDIIILSTNEDDVKLTTFYPYQDGNCGDYTPVPFKEGKTWFPKKFTSFHGCTIRVTVLPFAPYIIMPESNETARVMYGLDGLMFSLIVEKLNATVDLIMCKDLGQVGTYTNGNGTGCFGDLINNRSDFFAPSLVLDHIRYAVVQISHTLHMIDLSWFGPPRRPVNQWRKILHPFMTDTSYAVNATFLCFILIAYFVKRYGFQRSTNRISISLQSLIILLGQGVRLQSHSWELNYLFVFWVWFCMIIRIAYQVDLVDGLQNTMLEAPLIYLDQALKEVDGYGGLAYPHKVLNGTKYYKNYKLLSFENVRLQTIKMSDGKRFLLASERFLTIELGTGLQTLKEPISRVLVSFLLRPGWPPARDVDTVLVRLIEAGFLEKIFGSAFSKWTKNEDRKHDKREAQPLDMNTLSGCFYGLGFMYLLCVIIFMAEIVYYKLKTKSEMRQAFS